MLNSATLVIPPTLTSELAEFVYDADGNRVKKIYNGVTTIYVGELYEKTGSLITKHIYLGTNRIASKTSTDTLYYHSDHLGSSNVVTNVSGQQVQLSEYKPYGELSLNTADNVNYYFTGKELDPTGLYYYGARYYDPKVGRFVSADTMSPNYYNPQALNRYSYCFNNPLKYIDPSGNEAISTIDSPLWYDQFASFVNFGIGQTKDWLFTNFSTSEIGVYSTAFLATALDFGAGILKIPSTIGHLGEGTGYFISDPSWETAPGMLMDVSLTASILATVSIQLNTSYNRYIGPESKPTYDTQGKVINKTWLTKDSYEKMIDAKEYLQLPNVPTSMQQVKVPWLKYVGGPQKATSNPQWGIGGGTEYRFGGFEGFLQDIINLLKKWMSG